MAKFFGFGEKSRNLEAVQESVKVKLAEKEEEAAANLLLVAHIKEKFFSVCSVSSGAFAISPILASTFREDCVTIASEHQLAC